MEGDRVGGNVERREKWNPLDVIPMKVGHEKMDGASRYGGFSHTFDPEVPQTGAAIDDQNRAIRKAHLETGRVPPKA